MTLFPPRKSILVRGRGGYSRGPWIFSQTFFSIFSLQAVCERDIEFLRNARSSPNVV